MAIVSKLQKARQLVGKSYCRKNMKRLKQAAHRRYRRCAKQAWSCGLDVDEKPRLTGWDIV